MCAYKILKSLISSFQVVFESEKLSVLVADPQHTKVNIRPESVEESSQERLEQKMANETDYTKSSAVDAIISQVIRLKI